MVDVRGRLGQDLSSETLHPWSKRKDTSELGPTLLDYIIAVYLEDARDQTHTVTAGLSYYDGVVNVND
jgi:hypothetical protein